MDIWQLLYTAITDMKNYSICYPYNCRQVYLFRIWNSLPNDIKNAPSFSIFKRVIKPFLRVRQNAT